MFIRHSLLLTLTLILTCGSQTLAETPCSEVNIQRANAVIDCYFAPLSREDITIKPLVGGYSGAANFYIEVNSKRYALRLQKLDEDRNKVATELYMLQKAAELGLAPTIHYVGDNGFAVLMDYIDGGTLSWTEAKKLSTIVKIGHAIALVHGIPDSKIPRDTFVHAMERFYQELGDQLPDSSDADRL